MARLGFELWKIQLAARWTSPIVLRYVQDTPLEGISDEYRRRAHLASLEDIITGLRGEVQSIRAWVDESGAATSKLVADEMEARKALEPRALTADSWFIISGYGVSHVPTIDGADAHPALWRTRCGWHYGTGAFTRSRNSPADTSKACARCLPHLCRELQEAGAGELSE